MLAFCGLKCDTCPIFIATLEEDKTKQYEMRKMIAENCFEIYRLSISPEQINDCDGCKLLTGRLFSGCQVCNIRKCAIEKRMEHCAFCDDFACSNLKEVFSREPEAKMRLDAIRYN